MESALGKKKNQGNLKKVKKGYLPALKKKKTPIQRYVEPALWKIKLKDNY